ncbi:MAG: hypothetical protein JW839_18310 [Candidatus Lokiarchaeota archaeon]|nr:hypothetical protein [Candidatus Lokiarchaeota archaeon]
MDANIPLVLALAAALGVAFFFADMYNQKVNINPSFIAGVSVSYFFLVTLPEIAGEMPVVILGLPALEYVFILVGVSYAHILEKFILQHVEHRSREKAELLTSKKATLDEVEDQMSVAIANGLKDPQLDHRMVVDMATSLKKLVDLENDICRELASVKKVLHDHVNERLEQFHDVTEFIYHCIVGFILAGLLLVNVLEALLFYTIAILMATISHTSSRQRIFSNLDIEMDYVETRRKRAELALAAPVGIVVSLVLQLTLNMDTEFIYILFSFIAGALLYVIMREVIPEKEKGRLARFVAGLVGFSALVIVLNALGLAF